MNRLNAIVLFLYILNRATKNYVTANVTLPTVNNDVTPFVNDRLKMYINKLFYSLKINRKFRRSYKIKLLLIMYDNLNNAIEFNWNTYSNIKNSVAVVDYFKNNYFYKLVADVLKSNELLFDNSTEENNLTFVSNANVKNDISDKKSTFNTTSVSIKKGLSPQKDNMLERLKYRMNKLTAEDLLYYPINKTHLEIDKNHRYKIIKRRNMDLKTWDPNEYPDDRLSMTRRKARAEMVEKYPFVASIHVMDKFTCTGSIISKNAVLTAASCLPFSYDTKMIQQMPDIIQVRVGSDFANHYGEMIPIVDVEFHPKYDTKTLKNNLAIIRLNKLQKYARSRPKVRKIRMSENLVELRSSLRNVQILGFGAGNEDLKGENQQLVVVNLDLMPLKQCKDVYSEQFVNNMNFCGGFKASRRNSNCNGDVGAPGVSDGHLVGIVSFGPPVCGRHDAPTVFIKIVEYISWISLILTQEFKIPNPLEISGSREYRSTRLYLEEDINDRLASVDSLRTTTPSSSPNQSVIKQHVFKEIKSILTHMSNPTDHHRYTRKPSTHLGEYDDKSDNDFDKLINEVPTPTPTSAIHHPLINKSIIPIPGIHYTVTATTFRTTTKLQRPDIGLPENLPYDYIADRIKTSEELDYFIQLILKEFGKGGMGQLPWQQRGRQLEFSSTKAWHGGSPEDGEEDIEESHERKMDRISKNMQKYRQKNDSFKLRVDSNADEDAKGDPKARTSMENIFEHHGHVKIIGPKITRPYVTLLDVVDP